LQITSLQIKLRNKRAEMKKFEYPTLKLFIKREWFDQIQTGKKKIEYRDNSPFWRSRLYDKNGKKRKYESIEFINGYKRYAPRMCTTFKGFDLKRNSIHIHIGKVFRLKNV
jgi:hypothetical protein